jgi:hypothetical protein
MAIIESVGQNGKPRFIVEIGTRFGQVVVTGRAPNSKHYYCSQVVIECDCGTKKIVVERALRRGKIKSCGCARRKHARSLGEAQVNRSQRVCGRFMPAPIGPNEKDPNTRENGTLQLRKCYVCVPTGRTNQPHMISRGQCAWCGWRDR